MNRVASTARACFTSISTLVPSRRSLLAVAVTGVAITALALIARWAQRVYTRSNNNSTPPSSQRETTPPASSPTTAVSSVPPTPQAESAQVPPWDSPESDSFLEELVQHAKTSLDTIKKSTEAAGYCLTPQQVSAFEEKRILDNPSFQRSLYWESTHNGKEAIPNMSRKTCQQKFTDTLLQHIFAYSDPGDYSKHRASIPKLRLLHGSRFDAAEISDRQLAGKTISHVINVGGQEASAARREGANVPAIVDFDLDDDPKEDFPCDAVAHAIDRAIQQAAPQGAYVLVNCKAGMSRSATAIAAYLIKYQGLKLDEAKQLILSLRRCSTFRNFDKQLQAFAKTCTSGAAPRAAAAASSSS